MTKHDLLPPNPESRIRIKEAAGWFVAGEGFRCAIGTLSDGAFKLFVYISMHADRQTGCLASTHKELAAALDKSKRIIGTYVAELGTNGFCRIHPGKNQFAATIFEVCDRYWPYQRSTTHTKSSEVEEYVESVRKCFEELGCTSGKLSAAGTETARQLYQRRIPLDIIRDAMVLGACRKLTSWLNSGLSAPIQNMNYFETLIAEIQATPLPAGYAEYLRGKLPLLVKEWRKNAGAKK